MKAGEWIDRAKLARGWPTDYRAAKELKISRNTVSNYRQNPLRTMTDETAVRVAIACGLRPEIVVLDQVRERSRSDLVRQVLADAIERLQREAAPAPRAPRPGRSSSSSRAGVQLQL